uniref:Protein YIPF3 n=1 Tax=Lygus hesperus TaxID=30085 RepID=A0A146LWC1_LYGHE
MKAHSVIFIDQYDQPKYERFDRRFSNPSLFTRICSNFRVVPWELPKRIFTSFVPPILGENSRKVYVDFVGPLLAVVLLWSILTSGHYDKHPKAMLETPPVLSLVYYCLAMPSLCLFLAKAGNSNLTLPEIIALLGYGLYGHLATIFLCYLFSMESSNFFFFTVMIFFSGLSALRLVIVLLMTIPKPAARLIVCSVAATFHVLFLIHIHFSYMHKTFVYGGIKITPK